MSMCFGLASVKATVCGRNLLTPFYVVKLSSFACAAPLKCCFRCKTVMWQNYCAPTPNWREVIVTNSLEGLLHRYWSDFYFVEPGFKKNKQGLLVCIGHKITKEGYNVSFLALLRDIRSWTFMHICIHELWATAKYAIIIAFQTSG